MLVSACGVSNNKPESVTVSEPACDATKLPTDAILVDQYRQLSLCNWTVYMHDDLYKNKLGSQVYFALAEDLSKILEVVPSTTATVLQETNIWLELNEPAFPGGVYHPSAQWLSANNYPEKWARGLQLGNARNYLNWVNEQPAMVLHEFAHALHHQKYGFENADTTAAFNAAFRSGLYNSVKHVDGSVWKAYAISDAKEYFAELTEAYFWKNDFYPFDRKDLTSHDPAGKAVVELLWNTP